MRRFFIKQYGAERTGTNVLRLLLKKRFTDVEVLMHTLGDKHSPAADYDALALALEQSHDPFEEIDWTTQAHPARTTDFTDPSQTDYVRAVSGELASAILENRLLFFVSIKEPYSWVYSFIKFQRMEADAWTGKHYLFLARACKDFNRRYASWLGLIDKLPERTYLVRFEDLIANPEGMAVAIRDKFHFQEDGTVGFHLDKVVNPTHWDDAEQSVDAVDFDREFYASCAYRRHLTPQIVQVVRNSIDWTLMERFGYHDSVTA